MPPVPLDALRQIFAEETGMRLALLFGSAARGALRDDSDLDIAILPEDPEMSLDTELTLQAKLSLAAGRDVDLVRLDRAPTLVKWEVAREGVLVFQATPSAASRFTAQAAAEYIDFAPAFHAAAERFRQRLAEAK